MTTTTQEEAEEMSVSAPLIYLINRTKAVERILVRVSGRFSYRFFEIIVK